MTLKPAIPTSQTVTAIGTLYPGGAESGTARALGNIGLVYRVKGDLDSALKYYQDTLKTLDATGLVCGRDIILRAIDSIKNM